MEKILVINPGSTSTKIAVYEDDRQIFVNSIEHADEELEKYDDLIKNAQNIGVTAGASTPDAIIENVINKLNNY